MGRALMTRIWMVCVLAVVSLQQVVGQVATREDVDEQLSSVIMMNQVALIESTLALKTLLNNTQGQLEQQCGTEDILVSMRDSLQRSEAQQSLLLNSSFEAWGALSEVPSTLEAIAQAADAYKPAGCGENKEVTNRLDILISAVEDNSVTTANAIKALQNTTMQMMEVLQQTIQLQSERNDRMKAEISQAQGCCNGIQNQMDKLVNVVTDIHKEMNGCREGRSCRMEGSNKSGFLKPCNKKKRKRRESTSCPLCCEPGIGDTDFQNRSNDSKYIGPPRLVEVIDATIETGLECCPPNFKIIGSECFYIARDLVEWFEARRKCDAMGGYIAKPSDTNPLANHIMRNYENKRWYWIERSDLDQVSQNDEDSVQEMNHNCHVFDAGQDNNQSSLKPSSCSGTWYYICQHRVTDECAARGLH